MTGPTAWTLPGSPRSKQAGSGGWGRVGSRGPSVGVRSDVLRRREFRGHAQQRPEPGFCRLAAGAADRAPDNVRQAAARGVHGKAIGGGATLLLHCDLVVAAADTQYRLPFTGLGAVPELVSSWLLPRAAGSKLANELLLIGKVFDAETAKRAGLINELVSPGEELALACQWAAQLAALAPRSVQASKRRLREAQHVDLMTAIVTEGEAFAAATACPEVQEATTAFLEKRRPALSKFH